MATNYLQAYGDLLRRIDEADFHVSEETERISLVEDFVPKVSELLQAGVDMLRETQAWYESDDALEGAADRDDGDSLSEIGALISTELAASNIADLAFVARGGLRICLDELKSAAAKRHIFMIASGCDTGMRRLRKALMSVESAIAEFEGAPQPMHRQEDLETSIETRRAYGRLRQCILGTGQPDDRQLGRRLQEIAEHFVKLRTLAIYPLIRIGDRLEMRGLYKRIQLWRQQPDRDLVEGHRLWVDLSGFARLIQEINNREELGEHDRLLLTKVWHQLFGKRDVSEVTADLLEELRRLEGRDEDLDQLLSDPGAYPAEAWRETLERLRRTLEAQPQQQPVPVGALG